MGHATHGHAHHNGHPDHAGHGKHPEPNMALNQSTRRNKFQNLWWAVGYNIVAINAQLLRRARLGVAHA